MGSWEPSMSAVTPVDIAHIQPQGGPWLSCPGVERFGRCSFYLESLNNSSEEDPDTTNSTGYVLAKFDSLASHDVMQETSLSRDVGLFSPACIDGSRSQVRPSSADRALGVGFPTMSGDPFRYGDAGSGIDCEVEVTIPLFLQTFQTSGYHVDIIGLTYRHDGIVEHTPLDRDSGLMNTDCHKWSFADDGQYCRWGCLGHEPSMNPDQEGMSQ